MTDPWEAFRALEARLEQRNARLDNWAVFTVVLAGIAVLLSVIAIGFGFRAIDESKRNIRAVGPATSTAVAAPASKGAGATCPPSAGLTGNVSDHGAAAASGSTLSLQAGDFFFSPTCEISVTAGTVTLQVRNTGQALHNVSVTAQNIDMDVSPGQTITVPIKVGAAPVSFFCKYHRTSGMVGALVPAGS
jgi:plastocyanin